MQKRYQNNTGIAKEHIMNEIKVELRLASKTFPQHQVLVQEFKFDTIRQESYWVTKYFRQYRLRSDAEAYAARFGSYSIVEPYVQPSN